MFTNRPRPIQFSLAGLFWLLAVPVFGTCPDLPESHLTQSALKALIQNPDCQITSIETLLPRLPRSFRSHYALMYRSRSLQGPHTVDYVNPRAIVFGGEALGNDVQTPTNIRYGSMKMAMTFNGKATDPGNEDLELVEVDTSPEAGLDVFRYFEIKFPKTAGLSWREAQSQIHFSPKNPAKCVACHGNPARPIWDGYPLWPGAFGSDNFITHAHEVQGYQAFLREAPQHPRYQWLEERERFYDAPQGKLRFNHEGSNSVLNIRLSVANGVRVARLMRSTPNFDRFRYAAMGATLGCYETLTQFFPHNVQTDVERSLESVVLRDLTEDNSTLARRLADRLTDTHLRPRSASERTAVIQRIERGFASPTMLRLALDTMLKAGPRRQVAAPVGWRYIFESRGIRIADWFMDLLQPTYRLFNGNDFEGVYALPLLEEGDGYTASEQRLLREVIERIYRDPDLTAVCSMLKTKSLQALSGYRFRARRASTSNAPVTTAAAGYPVTFLNTCTQCHTSGAIAPAIPFGEPVQMAQWLAADPRRRTEIRERVLDTRFPMPPNRRLESEETQAIMRYLQEPRAR